MLRPLDLASRLFVLLESKQATIVDMTNLQDQRDALNTCRAPALGWKDYMAGKEYEPPTKFNDQLHYYGPKDGTGWTKDDHGAPIRVRSNPYSANFGGVRPWSPDEIAAAMMANRRTTGYFPYGIRSMIERFKEHAQAARPGMDYDKTYRTEEFLGEAMAQLYMAIVKDKGRLGTEFTKYVALHMDLTGGSPAGYWNEHRTCRGILSKVDKMLNRIATQVESGNYDASALQATVGNLGSKKTKSKPAVLVKDADGSLPYDENPFGLYAGRMEKLYKHLGSLLANGDAEGIRAMRAEVQDFYEQVDEDEGRFTGEGMSHGKLGSQPKDLPAIGTSAHRFEKVKYLIYVVDPDRERMDVTLEEPDKKDVVLRRDPESGAPLVRLFGEIMARTEGRALSAARAVYAEKSGLSKMLVALLPFQAKTTEEDIGAGFGSVSSTTIGVKGEKGETEFIDDPSLSKLEQAVSDSDEFKAEMTELLHTLRYGSGKHKVGQAQRAMDVVKSLFSVIKHTLNPKPRPNLEARPDMRGHIDPDEPTTGRRTRSGGYNVVDVDKNQIVARADSEREAAAYLMQINNPVMTSLKYVSGILTRPKLGDDYYEELFELAKEIVQATRTGDEEALAAAAEELELMKTILGEDIAAGAETHTPLLSDREYRIAIRKLGIDNYPEKGTVNDPEIDEHGRLSRWAQAGYPRVEKVTSGGKGEMAGTLYAPGEEEQGEVVLDKHIAQDIGVSPQSVGNIWRKVQEKLATLAKQLYEHQVWTGDLDSIDLQVLRETCTKVSLIMIEDLLQTARRALLLG